MKSFFKTLLASILGVFIAGIIMFFVFIGIMSALVSDMEKATSIEPNSILKLTLENEIVERSSKGILDNIDIGYGQSKQDGLNEILENIEKAKVDPNIRGIYLELSVIQASIGTISEIRNALLQFKTSGKKIIAYGEYMSQGAYYLASVADEVYLNPEGSIIFKGAQAEVMFFKGALDKLGIEAQIIRHGKFKSAVEPFLNNKMSPENREQLQAMLDAIWNNTVNDIAKSRNISPEKVKKIANTLNTSDADSCVATGIVDSLLYKDQIFAKLLKISGSSNKEPKLVTLAKYKNVPKAVTGEGVAKNKIAVVYAFGDVVMGDAADGYISSEKISAALRKARKDTSIKAVVFRINSPGGSALASDIIWREVALTVAEKPVVASMGDLAASGGYYIACPASYIIAQPSTITGSIGVFGVMFNAKKLLNEKLGITTDVVKTEGHSDFPSGTRAMDQYEQKVMLSQIERIYNTFINHVAEGRKMKAEDVDNIGQGRVWAATDALKIGLVDTLGYIDDAIAKAAKMAKVEKYRVVNLPLQQDPWEKFINELSGEVMMKLFTGKYAEYTKYIRIANKVHSMQGIQARLPFELDAE
ncbi:MAG TPA: signal peptide peptidase SppA [Bacteroidales bacterium]|nr:signal peptide peptidase SppA [Bacteroidales bacterium]